MQNVFKNHKIFKAVIMSNLVLCQTNKLHVVVNPYCVL